jgi:hypothetical protein
MVFLRKTRIFLLIVLIILFCFFLLSRGSVYDKSELEYGVTFSKKQAQSLGLDWYKAYTEIFNDLKVSKIRLPAYWDEIEKENGQVDFTDLDWQVGYAATSSAEIILAIGGRLPRWPECHFPAWAEDLPKQAREEKILNYIENVINRYKDKTNIIAWQIENEPFLSHFGDCPELDKSFLDREIALARSLDSRPIVITDSGELSFWVPAARRADIFGTTMYRDTYSNLLKRYIHYPIEPGFFRFKKNYTRVFARPKEWVVIEMQAEPWGPKPFQDLSQTERDKTMSPEKFKEMINFSSQTGFKTFYLWGVEYWFWEKTVNNKPEMWEEARKLF